MRSPHLALGVRIPPSPVNWLAQARDRLGGRPRPIWSAERRAVRRALFRKWAVRARIWTRLGASGSNFGEHVDLRDPEGSARGQLGPWPRQHPSRGSAPHALCSSLSLSLSLSTLPGAVYGPAPGRQHLKDPRSGLRAGDPAPAGPADAPEETPRHERFWCDSLRPFRDRQVATRQQTQPLPLGLIRSRSASLSLAAALSSSSASPSSACRRVDSEESDETPKVAWACHFRVAQLAPSR